MTWFTYALLAGLTWAVAPILEKYALGVADPLPGLLPRSAGVLIGALLLAFFLPGWQGQVAAMGWRRIGALMLAGVLASLLGQFFAYSAMKRADVSLVSPVAASWPLLVLVFSWLILGESMTARKAMGSLLVVSGLWLLKY